MNYMTHPSTTKPPVALIILDGWGIAPPGNGNAIALANTPNFDRFIKEYPYTMLNASGTSVGLPEGQAGNSEAGHLNIGAGRVVLQDVMRINETIDNGMFFNNPAFEHVYQHAKRKKSNIHIMGLLSGEQSGHSHPRHIQAVIEFFRLRGVKNLYLHLFTDGRDTAPDDALMLVQRLRFHLQPGEQIVTLAGRLYLDRKKDWKKTEEIYNTLTIGSEHVFDDPEKYIKDSYEHGVSDEFIQPAVLGNARKKPVGRIRKNDSVVFFNLRSDRARQLSKPFVQNNFNKLNPKAFKRKRILKNINFVAMTDFGPDLGDILTAFPSPDIRDTLPVALRDYKQLYIGESEKFAHVTYFLNGGFTNPVAGEKREDISSPHVSNYARNPEMSSEKVVQRVCETIANNEAEFVAVNLANADMVSHTGDLSATIKACEVVDKNLETLYNCIVKEHKGVIVITADHGNAEHMLDDKSNKPDTSHDANPVPCIIVSEDETIKSLKLRTEGILADIAPTILDIMNVDKPVLMTGESLLK